MTKKRGVGNPTKYDPETTPQEERECCQIRLTENEEEYLIGKAWLWDRLNKERDLEELMKVGKDG